MKKFDPKTTEIKYLEDVGSYVLMERNASGKLLRYEEVKGVTKQISTFFNKYNRRAQLTESEKRMRENLPTPEIDNGTTIHKQISEYITQMSNFVKTTQIKDNIQKGTPVQNTEARIALKKLREAYPAEAGWEMRSEVPISDFNSYASAADIIIKNKKTNEVHIVDIKTGKTNKAAYAAQLSMYKRMYEFANPSDTVKGLHILNASKDPQKLGVIENYSAIKDSRLNEIFYPGIGPIKRKIISQDKLDLKAARELKAVPENVFGKPSKTDKKLVTVLDIETGFNREVLAIGAVKLSWNESKNKFDLVDTYKRYYLPTRTDTTSYHMAQDVHRLTPEIIKTLRKQQGLKYNKTYDKQEWSSLKEFMQGTIAAGHNSNEFDLSVLEQPFGNLGYTGTIDTLIAAENAGGRNAFSKLDLDTLYRHLTGRSMEAAGLPHHDALSDAIATAEVLQRMAHLKGSTGAAIRKVLNTKGISLAPKDSYTGSMIVIGNGRTYRLEDYVNDDISSPVGEQLGPEELKNVLNAHFGGDNSHIISSSDLQNENEFGGTSIGAVKEYTDAMADSLSNAITQLKDVVSATGEFSRDLGSTISVYNKRQARNELKTVAQLDDPDLQKKYLHALGYSASSAGTIIRHVGDYNEARQNIRDKRIRGRDEEHIEGLVTRGLISRGQADDLLADETRSHKELSAAISDVTAKNKAYIDVLDSLRVPIYDFNRIRSIARGGASDIFDATSGFLPKDIRSTGGYFFKAGLNFEEASMAKANEFLNNYRLVSPIATSLGSAIGGIIGSTVAPGVGTIAGMQVGGAAVGATMGLFNLGQQVSGHHSERTLTEFTQRLAGSFNILSGSVQILLLPLKMLTKSAKVLAGIFGGLSGIALSGVSSMSQLGTPLTSLTGVGYGDFQGLQMIDRLTGTSTGTTNKSVESFAQATQDLFTFGKFNATRVNAAAQLGVFDKVYNNGTSAEENYFSTVNTLANRLATTNGEGKARIMNLAGNIDSSLPQLLQVMSDLGIKDVRKYMDPNNAGVYFRKLSDNERGAFRRDNYQYTGHMASIDNSRQRIAHMLWNGAGNTLMGGVNKALDAVAMGKPGEALDALGASFKNIIVRFKDWIKGSDLGDWMSKWWTGIIDKIKDVLSGNAFDIDLKGVKDKFGKIVDIMYDTLGSFITYLSTLHFDAGKFISGKPGFISFGTEKYSKEDKAKKYFDYYGVAGDSRNDSVILGSDGVPIARKAVNAKRTDSLEDMLGILHTYTNNWQYGITLRDNENTPRAVYSDKDFWDLVRRIQVSSDSKYTEFQKAAILKQEGVYTKDDWANSEAVQIGRQVTHNAVNGFIATGADVLGKTVGSVSQAFTGTINVLTDGKQSATAEIGNGGFSWSQTFGSSKAQGNMLNLMGNRGN